MTKLTKLSPEQSHDLRRAIKVGHIIGASSLLFVFLGIYLAITVGTWQAYGFTLLAVSAALGGFVSATMLRQGKMTQGAWLLLVIACLAPALAAWIIADFGFASIAFIAVSAYFIYYYVMPWEVRPAAFASTLAAIVVSAASLFVQESWQLVSPVMSTTASLLAGALVVALLFVFARQAWYGGLRNKILIVLTGVIVALVGTVTVLNIYLAQQEAIVDEDEILTNLYVDYNNDIKTLEESAAMLSISLADRGDIKQLYVTGRRAELLNLLIPMFETLRDEYDIRHLYIEGADGKVFLRVHNPSNFGDDVTYRPTAATALQTRQTVTGVDIGPNRIGIRSVSPILDNGRFIGMLEVGLDYDQSFIDNIKAQTGADYTMWVTHDAAAPAGLKAPEGAFASPLPEEMFFYSSTTSSPLLVDEEIYRQVLATGQPAYERVSSDEGEFALVIAPLLGYGDRTIGLIEISISRADVLATLQSNLRAVFFTAALLLLAALALMWATTQFIVIRPLGQLAAAAQRQLEGDLSARVSIQTGDELEQLGKTLNTVTAQLQETLQGLEERVAARTMDLATVSRISTNIAAILDPFQMIATAVHLTQRGFNLYHAHVFEFNTATSELQIVACGYKEGDEHEGTHGTAHIPLYQEQSLVARAARTRKPVIVNDVRSDPGWLPNPLLPETRAELAVPMIVGDELIGVLDVQAEYVDAFTEEDAAIQLTLAAQIAVALKNARSYEAAKTQAELETLANTIGQKIQRAATVEETLQTAARELGLALGASRVKARIAQPRGSDAATSN